MDCSCVWSAVPVFAIIRLGRYDLFCIGGEAWIRSAYRPIHIGGAGNPRAADQCGDLCNLLQAGDKEQHEL